MLTVFKLSTTSYNMRNWPSFYYNMIFSLDQQFQDWTPRSRLDPSSSSNPIWFPQFPRRVTPEEREWSPCGRRSLGAVTREQAWASTRVSTTAHGDCARPRGSGPLGARASWSAAVAEPEAHCGPRAGNRRCRKGAHCGGRPRAPR